MSTPPLVSQRDLGPVSRGLAGGPNPSRRSGRPEPAAPEPAAASPVNRAPAVEDESGRRFSFSLKPRDLKAHLDRFVVKQDEAKKALSVALCDHFQHVRLSLEGDRPAHYVKQNVLLLGPTGVGKTHLIRSAAELIGVPFVKADATKYSETGYVGGDVEDLVRDLIRRAGGDLEEAARGIIYLDEIDKIAGRESNGRDVSGRGVQTNLLKLMEDGEVPIVSPNDIAGQVQSIMPRAGAPPKPAGQTINTGDILFIVSGAFAGLAPIVRARLGSGASGPVTLTDEEALERATTGDFIAYGFEPEFVGRLPIRVACRPLGEGDLYEVMRRSESSLLRQYERAFQAYGVRVRWRADGLKRIARLAALENTGARGLMTVCERVLRGFKFDLPSTDIREFTVTRELVDNPGAVLARTLAQAASGAES